MHRCRKCKRFVSADSLHFAALPSESIIGRCRRDGWTPVERVSRRYDEPQMFALFDEDTHSPS